MAMTENEKQFVKDHKIELIVTAERLPTEKHYLADAWEELKNYLEATEPVQTIRQSFTIKNIDFDKLEDFFYDNIKKLFEDFPTKRVEYNVIITNKASNKIMVNAVEAHDPNKIYDAFDFCQTEIECVCSEYTPRSLPKKRVKGMMCHFTN